MRDWKKVNNKYIKEGELYLSFDFLQTWRREVRTLNNNKEGAKYIYPNSLIRFCSILKVVFHLGYRQEQGTLCSLSNWLPMPSVISYSQIQRRINNIGLDILDSLANPEDGQVIAIDSTGIKLFNSGEWIREKHKKRKPYLKLHIAVNIKTKQAVAINITEDSVSYNKKALLLIRQSNSYAAVEKALMDGAYDDKRIWQKLSRLGIEPVIRLPKNACPKGLGIRPKAVRRLKEIGKDAWVKETGYGQRWQAETWYSSFKRRFGEYCYSVKAENIVQEITLKACLCNMLIV